MAEERRDRVIIPGWGVGKRNELDDLVPDEVNGMPVTPELRKMYEGFAELIALCVSRDLPEVIPVLNYMYSVYMSWNLCFLQSVELVAQVLAAL